MQSRDPFLAKISSAIRKKNVITVCQKSPSVWTLWVKCQWINENACTRRVISVVFSWRRTFLYCGVLVSSSRLIGVDVFIDFNNWLFFKKETEGSKETGNDVHSFGEARLSSRSMRIDHHSSIQIMRHRRVRSQSRSLCNSSGGSDGLGPGCWQWEKRHTFGHQGAGLGPCWGSWTGCEKEWECGIYGLFNRATHSHKPSI